MFTQEDLKNLAILIGKSSITGSEAITVALLQQKIAGLIENGVSLEETKSKK